MRYTLIALWVIKFISGRKPNAPQETAGHFLMATGASGDLTRLVRKWYNEGTENRSIRQMCTTWPGCG